MLGFFTVKVDIVEYQKVKIIALCILPLSPPISTPLLYFSSSSLFWLAVFGADFLHKYAQTYTVCTSSSIEMTCISVYVYSIICVLLVLCASSLHWATKCDVYCAL